MEPRGEKADIQVEVTIACAGVPVDPAPLETLAESVCLRFGAKAVSVSIAIVDDGAIQQVNEQFLGEPHTTDVISFDLSEAGAASFELVVNMDEAVRQSRLRNHSPAAELALYVTHGLLHHLGFDDARPEDAERMHAAENAILEEAGYGKVYGEGPA
ncbi:MAG: rRNA maturation RNase YbeY [Phycisphaerae bacterium]|nr:rRNA maturation RNase YbeY [Phycisphaerae bacterium]